MKKIKNKFIFILLSLIALIITFQVYKSYSFRDTNSYALLLNWTGYINNDILSINSREVLNKWDLLKTIWDESIIIIEWWDNSITRLWWNTEVKINENYVSDDLTKIQISLNLISWKTWNNLVTLFWKDSYFRQYIDDVEAWVRGTIFEVNKDKDYIYVQNHEVSLKNITTQKEIIIREETPVSIKSFSFIEFWLFLSDLKDKAWEDLNKKMDSELFISLQSSILKLHSNNPVNTVVWLFSNKQEIINSISDWEDLNLLKEKISKLSNNDKIELFNDLFSKYQTLNFLSPNDNEYSEKLYYKELLLQTSTDEENTKSLVKSTLYDINEMISSNSIWKLNDTINLLVANKSSIKNINLDFNSYVNLSSVPDSLKESMIKSLDPLKGILNINLDFSSLSDIEQKARWKVSEFLDENVWWLIEAFKNLNNK